MSGAERGITQDDVLLEDQEPFDDDLHDWKASEQGYLDEDYIDEPIINDREGLDDDD